MPILSAFVRDGGQFRHTWSSELMYAPLTVAPLRRASRRCATTDRAVAAPLSTHHRATGVFALAAVAEPGDQFEHRVECGL